MKSLSPDAEFTSPTRSPEGETAGAAYRSHLDRLAADPRAGDGTHSGGMVRAMTRAFGYLPAGRLDPPAAGRVLVWSDQHFGDDNVIRHCDRPFDDVDEMNRSLFANWEDAVGDEDTLLFLGDVAKGSGLGEGTWRRIRDGSGRAKLLVAGNHDLTGSGLLRVDGFDAVHSLLWMHGDPPLLFTHLPLDEVPSGWVNVHGHAHRLAPTRTPHINMCVEQIDYRSLALTRILTLARDLVVGRFPPGRTTLERVAGLNMAGA